MGTPSRSQLISCIQLMMFPLVRFCLRHSVNVQDFIESARQVFVQAAADEMINSGKKVNVSRISVMTGLQRKAIERIYREGEVKESVSRIDRVIGQWRHDRRFLSGSGRPRILSSEGEQCEFNRLVRSVSKELHPSSVLFELERLGVVLRTPSGLKLRGVAYEPRHETLEAMKLLSRDTDDLMSSVLGNIESANEPGDLPNFHAASIYDNISQEDIPRIRKWFLRSCSSFHSRVEKFLAEKDLDVNPDSKKPGGKRVVFTSFTRTT